MLFVFRNFALLIECDEHGHADRAVHDENNHILVIKQWVEEQYGLSRLYQVRVNPDGKAPMFKKQKASNGEQMFQITGDGEKKMLEVFESLKAVIDCGLDETCCEALFVGSVEEIATERLFF